MKHNSKKFIIKDINGRLKRVEYASTLTNLVGGFISILVGIELIKLWERYLYIQIIMDIIIEEKRIMIGLVL